MIEENRLGERPIGRAGSEEHRHGPALMAEKMRATDNRISAKRLLPAARAAGFVGSDRNFRRAVAKVKKQWARQRRVYRPWLPVPREHLVIDWCTEGGWQVFCAVLPWSRWRFVGVARDQKAETTMRLLAECFEEMGGTPKVVLTDRMDCLKGGVVANVVIPTPDFVRFATHFGFRPNFCEAADPESKGIVAAVCGCAQRDLVVRAEAWVNERSKRERSGAVCGVNGRVHFETAAVSGERLVEHHRRFHAGPPPAPRRRQRQRRRERPHARTQTRQGRSRPKKSP